jgi:hypothetical protein
VAKPERKAKTQDAAKSSPPSAAEWQDVIGRIVIKGLANAYTSWMFSGIEDEITDRELQSVMLTSEDLDEISAPIAGFASKNSFLQKHGRSIVSFAGSYEAILGLLIWARRVNKVARKHRRAIEARMVHTPEPGVFITEGRMPNGLPGQDVGPQQPGVPPFGVYNPGAG